ncbi:3'-5' exonuclease [Streptomyces glaucus]|uniref:Exonuclease domain-containing protein n=1 Tax=Streptomyces glaucus TaxID=284029 RepID=A0ABP5WXT8_9ACTN
MNYAGWPRPLLVVDVEGNGANPPDLVEVALLPVEDGRVHPDRARQWLIHPPVPIPGHIIRIHGITNEMTFTSPRWPAVAEEVGAALEGAWIVAHNAGVEYGVLTRHLPDWQPAGVIDTLRLAKAALPGHKGFGLDALLTHTSIPLDGVAGTRHRATYDAHATGLLLLHLAQHYNTWQEIAAVAVPPGMPGRLQHEENTLW